MGEIFLIEGDQNARLTNTCNLQTWKTSKGQCTSQSAII